MTLLGRRVRALAAARPLASRWARRCVASERDLLATATRGRARVDDPLAAYRTWSLVREQVARRQAVAQQLQHAFTELVKLRCEWDRTHDGLKQMRYSVQDYGDGVFRLGLFQYVLPVLSTTLRDTITMPRYRVPSVREYARITLRHLRSAGHSPVPHRKTLGEQIAGAFERIEHLLHRLYEANVAVHAEHPRGNDPDILRIVGPEPRYDIVWAGIRQLDYSFARPLVAECAEREAAALLQGAADW